MTTMLLARNVYNIEKIESACIERYGDVTVAIYMADDKV